MFVFVIKPTHSLITVVATVIHVHVCACCKTVCAPDRLEIRSKPLDIVYNPAVIKRVTDFFHIAPGKHDPFVKRRAEAKYEEIKRNTQAEFKQALARFLEGDEQVRV